MTFAPASSAVMDFVPVPNPLPKIKNNIKTRARTIVAAIQGLALIFPKLSLETTSVFQQYSHRCCQLSF